MTEQEQREKVIKGLEHEIERTKVADTEWLDCVEVALLRDALVLLQAQEPVEPTISRCDSWWYECGKCHTPIDQSDKYCRHCGMAVKWEIGERE